ncbi:hypothetical protein ACJRO7_007935 [Eucalyptus globulus]|uniref:Uncharacterized protein n=1 Tax=Eucalyptus globulus TaxID=34317 RepID=A0ABD3IPT7_EUCGL
MALRNPKGDSKTPTPPIAAPSPVAFPVECFITCVCPCITFGQNAEIIDRGNIACMRAASLCCLVSPTWICSCFYTCTYRTKLRGLYSIRGNQCEDCFAHLCCQSCALCQEFRELKNRGFDPSFGWAANAEQMSRLVGVTVPPSNFLVAWCVEVSLGQLLQQLIHFIPNCYLILSFQKT